MKHKYNILKLRKEGKSYKEISRLLNCSLSTISFHCSTEQLREKYRKKEKIIKEKVVKNKKEKQRFFYEEYIKRWKEGLSTGGRGDKNGHGYVSHHVRRYLFIKYNNKCSKCGWCERNSYTNSIPLEVDHIDGDPMNHKEENLQLLCPNCHSLTRGHSSSKGNGRRYYRRKYYREKVGQAGLEPANS